jgi:UDP-2-acetamido-2-deoxy-ribo-hexuluronate aminotransferase
MIPFIDLAAQQARIKPQIDAAIARVLEHGKYIMGPEVAQLENDLCEFVGSKHCITVSNGTDALIAALMALKIGPGDAVITTPFTFFATVEAIMFVGATPVFADIDSATFNICPNEIEKAILKTQAENKVKVKAIMPVDLFGLCADYDTINSIAKQYGLAVVQDAAQAFGASTPDGRRAPTHGLIGTTSFFPAKPLGCYGDGGACFTDDDQLAEMLRSIRVHGKGADKYDNVRVGQNCRLDTIQAAILIEKLKIYQSEIEARQKLAQAYTENFQLNQEDIDVVIPAASIQFTSVWAQFTIRIPQRDVVSAALKEKGIPTVVYYRNCCHLLRACDSLGYAVGDFPTSERASASVLSVPFHPNLDVGTVSQIVKHFCAGLQSTS